MINIEKEDVVINDGILLDFLLVHVSNWDDTLFNNIENKGWKIVGKLPQIKYLRLQIPFAELSEGFQWLEEQPSVLDVTFDRCNIRSFVAEPYHVVAPNALVDSNWAMKRMNVFHAWKYTTGDPSVRVGVVDTGLSAEWLSKTLIGKDVIRWNGYQDDDGNLDSIDTLQHGSMCSMIATANKGTAFPCGIAPDCSLAHANQYGQDWDPEYGYDGPYVSSIWATVNSAIWCIDHGCRIISGSWGWLESVYFAPATYLIINPLWKTLFDYIDAAGGVLFVASGNYAFDDRPDHPPQYSNVSRAVQPAGCCSYGGHFSVANTNFSHVDEPTNYCNHGSTVNMVVPGTANWVAWDRGAGAPGIPSNFESPFNDYFSTQAGNLTRRARAFDGTSCATPMSAGVAALILSANTSLSGVQFKNILRTAQDRPRNAYFSQHFSYPRLGVLNAAKGVLQAKALGSPGEVFPYIGFLNENSFVSVVNGVATTHLRGDVEFELRGYSTDAIVLVELWADSDLIYSGPEITDWDSPPSFFAASRGFGKNLRIVAYTATSSGSLEFNDVVCYANSYPPVTFSDKSSGQYSSNTHIILSSQSSNPPVTIKYRWGDVGPWSTYSDPVPIQEGTLYHYGVDAIGNVEGGVDYALL